MRNEDDAACMHVHASARVCLSSSGCGIALTQGVRHPAHTTSIGHNSTQPRGLGPAPHPAAYSTHPATTRANQCSSYQHITNAPQRCCRRCSTCMQHRAPWVVGATACMLALWPLHATVIGVGRGCSSPFRVLSIRVFLGRHAMAQCEHAVDTAAMHNALLLLGILPCSGQPYARSRCGARHLIQHKAAHAPTDLGASAARQHCHALHASCWPPLPPLPALQPHMPPM